MQGIMEAIFETGYLLFAFFAGIFILVKGHKKLDLLLFGISTLILGFGDSFHLIPRMIALNTTGTGDYIVSLGVGKLITSITMTIFYVILYFAYKIRYKKEVPIQLDIAFILLALVRIILCAFPQNNWFVSPSSYLWGIIRNIPFIIMGGIFIYLSLIWCKEDKYLKYTWLLVSLSFIFYLLTVLVAPYVSIMGLMMLPKTICYIILILLELKTVLLENKLEETK